MKNLIAVAVGLVVITLAAAAAILVFAMLVFLAGSHLAAVGMIFAILASLLVIGIALHIGRPIVEWFNQNVLGTGAYK